MGQQHSSELIISRLPTQIVSAALCLHAAERTAELVDELLGGLTRGKHLPRSILTHICGGDQALANRMRSHLSNQRFNARQQGGEEAAPKRQSGTTSFLLAPGAQPVFVKYAALFSSAGVLAPGCAGKAVEAVCAELATLPAVQQDDRCLSDLAAVPSKVKRLTPKGRHKSAKSSQWHAVRNKLARLAAQCTAGPGQQDPTEQQPPAKRQRQRQHQQQQQDTVPGLFLVLPPPSNRHAAHDPADAGRSKRHT